MKKGLQKNCNQRVLVTHHQRKEFSHWYFIGLYLHPVLLNIFKKVSRFSLVILLPDLSFITMWKWINEETEFKMTNWKIVWTENWFKEKHGQTCADEGTVYFTVLDKNRFLWNRSMCHSIKVESRTTVAAFAKKTNMIPFFWSW